MGSVRQRSVTSAAEQTGGDSRAPSFTAVIRSSRTAHHMGWHSLFIQSPRATYMAAGGEECVCVSVCTEVSKSDNYQKSKDNKANSS